MKRHLPLILTAIILMLVGQYAFPVGTTTAGSSVITGTLAVTGHVTLEGVTSTGATGTGLLVSNNGPTFIAPVLGTPASGVATNLTNIPVANAKAGDILPNQNYYGTLGTTFIATAQTTMSTTFVALSTPDDVTFTCAATCNVAIISESNCFGAATIVQFQSVFVDTVQGDDGNQAVVNTGTTTPLVCVAVWKASGLSAASHTVEIRYKVNTSTGTWRDRMTTVWQTP